MLTPALMLLRNKDGCGEHTARATIKATHVKVGTHEQQQTQTNWGENIRLVD